jgi:predicted N-acetyltransferase YhbS
VLTSRQLSRQEVAQVWSIDRTEVIDKVYYLKNGSLVLRSEHHDVRGWPPGEAEHYSPMLLECFDRGGWCCGQFDDARLVGAAILESRFIGRRLDQLQLKFLHVSNADRGRGIGRHLFESAKAAARANGARQLYISAIPSEHTVKFYLRSGCRVTKQPDRELLALEPDDIHLECDLD